MIKFFRGAGPAEVFLIILVATGVWAGALLHPHLTAVYNYDTNPMPLYGFLKMVIGENVFFGVIFSFSLVLLMSFLVVNFNTSQFFINERTFLPGVIYILLSGLFPSHQLLNPVLPASIFLMMAIRRIMDGYRIPGTAYNFFDASLLIGAGSLFYANLVWFQLLVVIGIILLRTGNIKELVISLLGFITPALLTVGFYYVLGKDIVSLPVILNDNLFSFNGQNNLGAFVIAGLILLGLIVIASTLHLISLLGTKKIKSGKTFSELIWALVLCCVVYYALPSVSVELIWLAAIPISYILAHFLIFSKKKLVPEIFFAALFLIIIGMQIWNLR
jgi:hypothetical protein